MMLRRARARITLTTGISNVPLSQMQPIVIYEHAKRMKPAQFLPAKPSLRGAIAQTEHLPIYPPLPVGEPRR